MTASSWGPGDRALMLAYKRHLQSLCKCGEPIVVARHPDMDGYYEVEPVSTCHACTAVKRHQNPSATEPVEPVEFYRVIDTRDYERQPLPPWPTRR